MYGMLQLHSSEMLSLQKFDYVERKKKGKGWRKRAVG